MLRHPHASTLASAAVLAWASTLHGAVIYVDADASGADDGSSWANAFTRIRQALNAASAGDEIRIAQGRYAPANAGGPREATISLPEGVVIDGGYAGFGEVDPDARDPETFITILTGDLNDDDAPDFVNVTDNSRHVITAVGVAETIVRGVTISGGNADGVTGLPATAGVGGGVLLLSGAAPTFVDCVFRDNQARFIGGGVFGAGASPILRRCIFEDNRAFADSGDAGAALLGANSRLQSCVFAYNEAGNAGGAVVGSRLLVTDCEFIGNSAGRAGGAIAGTRLFMRGTLFDGNTAESGGALRCGDSRLQECVFEDNLADRGAAIFNSEQGALSLDDCRFSLNSGLSGTVYNVGTMRVAFTQFDRNTTGVAGFDGGAIVNRGNAVLYNCDFFDNEATLAGGAIANDGGDVLTANCLFSGNTAGTAGGAVFNDSGILRVKNCTVGGNVAGLVSGNPGGAIRTRGGIARIHNSILWANSASGDFSERAQVFRQSGSLTLANCIVQGWTGTLNGVNTVADNPLFVDADGPDDVFGTFDDDPRVQSGSPAINAGDNAQLPPDPLDLDDDGNLTERVPRDLDDRKRIRQGIVDIGAYEFIP